MFIFNASFDLMVNTIPTKLGALVYLFSYLALYPEWSMDDRESNTRQFVVVFVLLGVALIVFFKSKPHNKWMINDCGFTVWVRFSEFVNP